jgi:Ni/Fe-hydrogenase subunit HybB-like protein
MGIYLVLKIADLEARGMMPELLQVDLFSLLMHAEILLVIIPGILLSIKSIRNSFTGLFISVIMIVAGLILNRFNVSLFAFIETAFLPYYPHWMEIMMSAAIVTGAILAFIAAAENLPVIEEKTHSHHSPPAHGVSHGIPG